MGRKIKIFSFLIILSIIIILMIKFLFIRNELILFEKNIDLFKVKPSIIKAVIDEKILHTKIKGKYIIDCVNIDYADKNKGFAIIYFNNDKPLLIFIEKINKGYKYIDKYIFEKYREYLSFAILHNVLKNDLIKVEFLENSAPYFESYRTIFITLINGRAKEVFNYYSGYSQTEKEEFIELKSNITDESIDKKLVINYIKNRYNNDRRDRLISTKNNVEVYKFDIKIDYFISRKISANVKRVNLYKTPYSDNIIKTLKTLESNSFGIIEGELFNKKHNTIVNKNGILGFIKVEK